MMMLTLLMVVIALIVMNIYVVRERAIIGMSVSVLKFGEESKIV